MPRISSEIKSTLASTGTAAWRRLSGRQADIVEELQMEDLRCVFRLHERSGGTVIAKFCPTGEAEREAALHEALVHRLPFPVLRCLGIEDAEPDEYTWLFLEDGGTRRFEPDRLEHRQLAGRWLGQFHSAGADLEPRAGLRSRGADAFHPLLVEAQGLVEIARIHPWLGTADAEAALDAVEGGCAALADEWRGLEGYCETLPRTFVHGDFKEDNVCIADCEGGPGLLVFDWNEAGWGPPALDLAKFRGRYRMQPDLAAYLEAMRERFPGFGAADVATIGLVGEGFRAVACIRWELEKTNHPRSYCSPSKLAAYAEWISLLLDRAPWRSG